MLLLFWKSGTVEAYPDPAYSVTVDNSNSTEYVFSVTEGRDRYIPSETSSAVEYRASKDGRQV